MANGTKQNPVTVLTRAASTLFWGLLISVAGAVMSEYVLEAMRQAGWFVNAGSNVTSWVATVRDLLLQPWVYSLVSALAGFLVGLRVRDWAERRLEIGAPITQGPSHWARGLQHIKLLDAASALAGIDPTKFPLSPRAKAIHTDLINDVRAGWIPLSSEVVPPSGRVARVWPDKFPEKAGVEPNAVVPVQALQRRYSERGWDIDWMEGAP